MLNVANKAFAEKVAKNPISPVVKSMQKIRILKQEKTKNSNNNNNAFLFLPSTEKFEYYCIFPSCHDYSLFSLFFLIVSIRFRLAKYFFCYPIF